MSEFYSEMAATVRESLDEFGLPLTIKRETGGTLDPITDTVSGSTPEALPTVGMFASISAAKVSELFGDSVMMGDRVLLLTDAVKPLNGDAIEIGGANWSVVSIDEKAPAGIPLIYRVLVRA